MTQDKRRSERHHVRFKLVYDDGHTFNAGRVSDVSETGIFLETALPIPVGTVVQLTPLDAEAHDLFEVRARVVRVIPYDEQSVTTPGMGLEFLGLSDDDRKKVVHLIRRLEEQTKNAEGTKDPFLGVIIPPSTSNSPTLRTSKEIN